MSEYEQAYRELEKEGIEINNKWEGCSEAYYENDTEEMDFLNSEDGQTLEKMYELAYGCDCN